MLCVSPNASKFACPIGQMAWMLEIIKGATYVSGHSVQM